MDIITYEKDYKKQEKTIKNYMILAFILIIISFLTLSMISRTEQHKKYKNLKIEYDKELVANKELIASKKEALTKMKLAQDTWNERQKRFSYTN